MSTEVGSIYYDLDLSDDSYNKKVDKASSKWDSFGKKISGVGSGIAKAMGNALLVTATAAATATATVLTVGTKFNAEIEQLQTSFEVMTGSSEKAVEVIDKLKKVGASTPYELKGLAQTTQTLMQYGFTADDAYNATLNLGDIAQGSAEKMQSIALAYGQMSSAGKVNMQDIKQMINAGFNPLQAIADKTGKTMQQVTADYEAGKISVQDVTAAMQFASAEGGKYYQSMEKQSQTLEGQVSSLKDNFSMLSGVLAGGVTDAIRTNALPAINDLLSNLTTAYESGGITGFAEALGKGIADMASKIAQEAPKFVDVIILVINSLISGIQTSLPTIMESAMSIINALITGILNLLPQVIQMGITLLFTLVTGLVKMLPEILKTGIEIVISLIQGIAKELPTLIPVIIDAILLMVQTLLENLPLIISTGIELIVALVEGIANALPTLIEYLPSIIESLVKTLIALSPQLIYAALQIVVALAFGLVKAIPTLIASIPSLIVAIYNGIVGAQSQIKDAGKKLVEGLWQGLQNTLSWLKDKITGWVGDVMKFIKKLFGIASPSKLMEKQVGFNLGAGIANGIKNSVGLVKDAMGGIGDAVEASVNPIITPTLNTSSLPSLNQSLGVNDLQALTNGNKTINQNIDINVDKINNDMDLNSVAQVLGFRASLIPA